MKTCFSVVNINSKYVKDSKGGFKNSEVIIVALKRKLFQGEVNHPQCLHIQSELEQNFEP